MINNLIYYRVLTINKKNKLCSEIRVAITESLIKYKKITLSKCSVYDNILYY